MGFVQLHFPETCFLSPSEQGEERGEEVDGEDAIKPYCSMLAGGVSVQMVCRPHSPTFTCSERALHHSNEALLTLVVKTINNKEV